jgi:hypothetical protein
VAYGEGKRAFTPASVARVFSGPRQRLRPGQETGRIAAA